MDDATTMTGAGQVDVMDGRAATVGSLGVRRALPHRRRRTVGAWCFADVMGPAEISGERGVGIGPHPHIGLHTVTWLMVGEVLHRDSLGSEQVVRPGQLNLMTAGAGVVHSEEGTGRYRGPLHGVQLWVAQPDATRHGPPAFEHHGELPVTDVDGAVVTVLVGAVAGERSPARADSPIVGAEVRVARGASGGGGSRLVLDPAFEHALVALRGPITVDGVLLAPGAMGYLAPGRDAVVVDGPEGSRAMLLGGVPFPEPVVMWWNFVGRDRAEVAGAGRAWNADDGRFTSVRSSLGRIDAPVPTWAMGA